MTGEQVLLLIIAISFAAPIVGAVLGKAFGGGAAGPSRRLFWILYGIGWGLFAFLVVTNQQMVTTASPHGITDHQVAGSAARVAEIQQAWQAAGKLGFARLSMATDLVFIGVLATAGTLGGASVATTAQGAIVRALGWLAAAGFLAFGAADYTETISQFIQAMSAPSESLAQLARTANGPKGLAFLGGHLLLGLALFAANVTRRKAAAV